MMKFFVLFILGFLVSCVPKTSQTTTCSAGQTYQESSRRCLASIAALATPSAIRQVPVNLTSSVTYSVTPREDTAFTATLAYNDANFDPALNCVVGAPTNIAQTSTCVCTAGVCSVSFLGIANVYGAASFTYYVIDIDGQSIATTVNLTMATLDDAPVASLASPLTSEDVMTNVVLPYTDVDGDIALSCSAYTIIPYTSEVSFPFGCNCVAGSCSAFALPSSNFNGTTYFFYTITSNGQTSNTGIVSLTVSAVNDAPVANSASQGIILEDTLGTATFTVSDSDGATPYTCTVFNETNLTETTACACVSTTCTVGLTPGSNLNSGNSSFSFDYTVTDAGAATSTVKTKTITVTAVDDAPISGVTYTSLTPAVPTEDQAVVVSLSYSDVDFDLATACTLTNLGNGTASACVCSGVIYPNTCSFTFTPTANINGTNICSFTYNMTTGITSSTTPVAVTFSLSPINDTPSITTPANVTLNEATTFDVTGIVADEGGGIDENAQVASVVITSSNQALIPNNQITLNFSDTGDASTIPFSLRVVPINGASGIAVITITVTDDGSPTKTTSTNFTVNINSIAFQHNGWKNIKAFGSRINASGTIEENPSVNIEWESFTAVGNSTLAGYRVYRSTTSGGQNYNSPLACNSTVNTCTSSTIVSSQVTRFIDSLPSSIGSGITYYYVVRPVDSNGLDAPPTETYAEVDVPVPPSNMVLMHKWIANKEACEKMGYLISNSTIDAANNFRCAYTGPGNNSGYYELSSHLFVDRFESGCNYSRAPKCSGNGCVGIIAPTAALPSIAAGDIYYNRTTGLCSGYNGAAWVDLSSSLGTLASALDREPNISNLPPLTQFTQAQATAYCGQVGRSKRLMTRLEQIAVSAWNSSLETNTITNLESGLLLSTNSSCNTMSGTGLTYSNATVPPSGSEDTLPATIASNLRMVQTGSTATTACVSRYGAQDLVGNVREWTSDTFGNCRVGADSTATTAAITHNGINYVAKAPGVRGNRISIDFKDAVGGPGNESVNVFEYTPTTSGAIYTVIEVNIVSGVTNASQVYNLLNSNATVAKNIDYKLITPTAAQAVWTSAVLTGGLDGGAAGGAAPAVAGSRATLATSNVAVYANIYGTYGNAISLEIVDCGLIGCATVVTVTGYGDVKITMDTVSNWGGWNAIVALANHGVANKLITVSGAVNFTLPQPMVSKTFLAGGGKSFCQGTSTNLSTFNGAGYNFDGNLTQANGPGNKNYTISSWILANTDANAFAANYMHVPMGLPSTTLSDGALLIGGSALSTATLSGDQIDVNTDPLQKLNSTAGTTYGMTRGVVSGGAWWGAFDRATGTQGMTGDKAGRYTMDLMPDTLQDNYTGFRCVKTVP